MEKTLNAIAEHILMLDEASLTALWKKYKTRMESFDTTREWEKSVIIFFIINAVRVKNQIFNDQVTKQQSKSAPERKKNPKDVSYLKRIK